MKSHSSYFEEWLSLLLIFDWVGIFSDIAAQMNAITTIPAPTVAVLTTDSVFPNTNPPTPDPIAMPIWSAELLKLW